jgi:hypothetical protein
MNAGPLSVREFKCRLGDAVKRQAVMIRTVVANVATADGWGMKRNMDDGGRRSKLITLKGIVLLR